MDIARSATPPGEAAPRSLAYRPEIDGLRAVAVLAVVAYHAFPALVPGGFVGVDVFFVISGYLITSLLAAEVAGTGRIDIAAFYARRARRLLPLLYVVIVATVALGLWIAPIGDFAHRLLSSAGASLLFAGNFYFQAASGGYFDAPAEEMPLLHLWSLAVEEQFYLLYPLALAALLRLGRGSARNVLALVCVLSLGAAEVVLQLWPQAAFYQMPPRFWELGVGATLALAPTRDFGRWGGGLLASAGLAVVAVAAFSTYAPGQFPGPAAIPAVLGALMVVAAAHGTPAPGLAGAVLRWRPVVVVGLLSYGLYLWHWPLLALDRATSLGEPPAMHRLAACAIALILAAITYRWVERPVRRLRGVPTRTVLWASGSTMAALVAATMLAGQFHETPEGIEAMAEKARMDQPALLHDCHYGIHDTVTALRAGACLSAPGEPRLAVWGDSHALAWQPFAWEVARSRRSVARMMTMDSCTPVRTFSAERADAPRHRENCARFNRLVLDELRDGRYRTVVIAARWLGLFPPRNPPVPARVVPGRVPMPPRVAFDELDAALAELAAIPEVILMMPPPELEHSAPRCMTSRREQQCIRRRADVVVQRTLARRMLREAASRHPNVLLVDPLDFFCDADHCPLRRGSLVMYWDDNHVSASASREFGRRFVADPGAFAIPRDGRTASPTRP